MAAPSDNSNEKSSSRSSRRSEGGVVIDIGTGDGRYVFRAAQKHPDKFFIGIDANRKPLEKISMKAARKLSKGRAENAMFIEAAVEDLPDELEGAADEVHIHFPWGSLLKAVIGPDPQFVSSVRRLCAPGAILELITGLDPERDATELARLSIDLPDEVSIRARIVPGFESAGFRTLELRRLSAKEVTSIDTTWAKKLGRGNGREVFLLLFEAV